MGELYERSFDRIAGKFAIFLGGLRKKSFDGTYWGRKFFVAGYIIQIFRPCALGTRTKVHWAGFTRNPLIGLGTKVRWAGSTRNPPITMATEALWAGFARNSLIALGTEVS